MLELLPSLVALSLQSTVPTEATGKRKVDGEYADTRLGKPISTTWANERFRQTMMLVREFRVAWPNQSLLTSEDVEFIRVAVDVALASAVRNGHVGDIYDLNATTWSIWLVQHTKAVRRGAWEAESEAVQKVLSFEYLYLWLGTQHGRGERWNVYDPSTRLLLHRYKLPFKANMRIPPKSEELFKWRKGAKRLSDWMVDGGLAPLDPAIQNLQPPALVAAPPLQAGREQARQALWNRVARQARTRLLSSVGGKDHEDAQLTRAVVQSVMSDSRDITDDDFAEAERELARDEQAEQQQQPQQQPGPQPDKEGIPVLAERIGPPTAPEDGLWHIHELLAEIRDVY